MEGVVYLSPCLPVVNVMALTTSIQAGPAGLRGQQRDVGCDCDCHHCNGSDLIRARESSPLCAGRAVDCLWDRYWTATLRGLLECRCSVLRILTEFQKQHGLAMLCLDARAADPRRLPACRLPAYRLPRPPAVCLPAVCLLSACRMPVAWLPASLHLVCMLSACRLHVYLASACRLPAVCLSARRMLVVCMPSGTRPEVFPRSTKRPLQNHLNPSSRGARVE